MEDHRLRNHIPVGGPATREPCTGNEEDFRVSIGFTPKWFHQRLGIDFSEQWHQDPLYRYGALLQMKALLHEKFPGIDHFKPAWHNGVEYSCATLSGAYGAMLISLVYGLEVHYYVDNWPSTKTEVHYSKQQLTQLPAIDLDANPAFRQLEEQMDLIENKWGRISGYLNYQGVLNNALRLRGQEIFMDMLDDPGFVKKLFEHICLTTIEVAKRVQQRQRKSGFEIDLISNSNCVINMISPEMYEEFVLPHDIKMSREFQRFGIHTCNWNATPYTYALSHIKKMGYIDMGIDTDMQLMKKVFPDAHRAVLYSPVKLEELSMEEIERDFNKIYRELGPCDLVLADLETTIPDSRVIRILELVDKVNSSNKKY